MSQPSQPGPSQRPSQSPLRRLQTPEERFGLHLIPEDASTEERPEAPDPFVALPPLSSGKNTRPKARHERRRFDREAHRIEPRRTKRRLAPPAHVPVAHIAPDSSPMHREDAAAQSEVQATPNALDSAALARIHARRRTFWKRTGALTLVLALVGAGTAALFAPQMNVEKVEISGLHATAPVLVRPIAARLLGHNAIRADKGAIVQSVERLPTVASARVVLHADLPPRVELQVVERKPIMRVGTGGTWWVADEAGNPYRLANAHDARLPALTWNGAVQTLKPLDATHWQEAMRLAEAVEENLGQKGMASLGDIRSMQLDANGDATMVLASMGGAPDLTLKLGNDQWNEKLARARTARLYFARTNRQAAELNLISLDLPRWTPRGVSVPAETASRSATPTPAT